MLNAVIVGSGFSGIAMAIELKKRSIEDFIILEKSLELGGTWRDNTYPGAECDIPSALYSYSFESYPDWEYKWSHQPQILDYLKMVAEKYDVVKHIHFGQEVKKAEWQSANHTWEVTTEDQRSFKSKHLILAVGQLHIPSVPNFKGQDLFKGHAWHSAQWNHDIDLTDKNIAVIGNAASAIQFIPQICKKAQFLTIFQRSANWMLPKQDRLYKSWEKALVRKLPFLLKLYRLRLWLLGGAFFNLMKKGDSLLRKVYERKSINYIRRHIKDEDKVQLLIPKYRMGAKRILFSDDYYEAIASDNVRIEMSAIDQITTNGIQTKDNALHESDIIIYATGFQTNPFYCRMQILGRDGISLESHWSENTCNYLGITTHDFPNLFMMYGPNTNLGHNSIIIMSEAQASYIAQCVEATHTHKWAGLEVEKEIESRYYEDIQKRLQNMIWSTIDNSWYRSTDGQISNNWPGRTMEYVRKTKTVNFDDYIILK